jgi:hypothetical protein
MLEGGWGDGALSRVNFAVISKDGLPKTKPVFTYKDLWNSIAQYSALI